MRRSLTVLVLINLFFLTISGSVLGQSDPSTPTLPPPNSPPIAGDDSVATTQGAAVVISVLANDSDPEGQALSVESVTQGGNGTVGVNPDQTLVFTPNPDFAGTDSFQYTVTDGNGGSATATVTVTVAANTPTPIPPTATPTDTPVPPTDTPVPPTSTPTPTATAVLTMRTLTFSADADARVEESKAKNNFGTSSFLRVDGGADPDVNSYLRFPISGVTGAVQQATLRVFVTAAAGTSNGPAVYGTSNNWIESGPGGINWLNQPGPTSGVIDDTGALAAGSWAEFNVTPLVIADGEVSFMLATNTGEGIKFDSRESATTRPELVVVFSTIVPTEPTPTPAPSATPTPTTVPTTTATAEPPTTTPADTPTATTVAATATPTSTPSPTPTVTATQTLTFGADADARVEEANPTSNFGTSTFLRVDGGTDPDVNSYLRFTVSGITGPIQQATLRVFITASAGTADGPAVYATSNTWIESGTGSITWANQPGPTSGVVDDRGALAAGAWAEFNVTPLVTADGTVSFFLATATKDGVNFYSRQNATTRPELVVVFDNSNPPTPTATTIPTSTSTPVATATATATPAITPTPAPTSITTGLTVLPVADARVDEASPTSNRGADSTLRVDGGTGTHIESYLRFDLPSFTGSVTSAKLRLSVASGTADGPAVYSADNAWTEYGVTWATRPSRGATPSDDTGALNAGTWAEFDVTPFVATFGLHSFALVAVSADGADFASREDATMANRPQLVLTIDPDGPSAPTPLPTATLVPTPTPLPGTHVIMAAGDMVCGADSTGGKCVQMQTAALLGPAEVVLPLGDVQYECGEPSDFTTYYDPSWGTYKDKSRPVVGNHEYNTSTDPTNKCYNNPPNAGGFFSYFGPLAGDAGKGYYSYDVGSWHLIALNSNCSKVGGCSSGSPQYQWLLSDLAAHPAACTIAYMHHPAFSSGGIGNISYVQPLWTALYDAGADIVLAGHDHNYERFAPQTPNGTLDTSYGIREFVVGTGGRNVSSQGTIKPNSEVRNFSTFGVLKLTLSPGAYQWQFLPIAGSSFTDSGSGTCHGAPGSASTGTSVAQIAAHAGAMTGSISDRDVLPWFVLGGFVAAVAVWSRRRFRWRVRSSR